MKKQINKSNPNAWTAAKEDGYTPVFINTKARRGSGLGTAFGKGVVMEDILNPPTKKIPRVESDEQVQEKGCHFYGAGDHDHYLDMRINNVSNRDMYTRAVQFLILPLYLTGYFIIRLTGALDWSELIFVDWGFITIMALVILFDFFKPIETPVRFNYKSQEVYAFHKGYLYRIPWKECEIACMYAPDYMGISGLSDAYNLNLWLYPKHCVNSKDSKEPIPLVLLNEGPHHSDIYNYWEYIRAFMEKGPDKVYTLKDTNPRSKISLKKLPIFIMPISYTLVTIILFIKKPAHLYLWLNPFKKKWPKEVHEWTGETINWH